MNGYFVLVLFAVVGAVVKGRNSVNGTIEEDTTWFLRDLSVRPAMTATLEYSIRYPKGEPQPVVSFYYKGQNSSNLQRGCNKEMQGQLCNKNLVVPLGRIKYRDAFTCSGSACRDWLLLKLCDYWDCHGKTKIQDFEPKSYFFSLGFECGERIGNLKGLKYDVTIYDESNKTSCVNLNKVDAKRIDRCDRSYQYAAIPNQVGDTDLDAAVSTMNGFLNAAGFGLGCAKKLKSFLCQIFLPECLPKENKILLPCRDTCKSLMEDCLAVNIYNIFSGIDVNCDYLPPCSSNGGVSIMTIIICLSVGACVIVVVMVTVCCVKNRKTIRNDYSKL